MSLPGSLVTFRSVAQRKVISEKGPSEERCLSEVTIRGGVDDNGREQAPDDGRCRGELAGVSVPTRFSRAQRYASCQHIETRSRRSFDRGARIPSERRGANARHSTLRRDRHRRRRATRYGYAEAIRGVEESARAAGYTATITVVESDEPDDVDRAVAATMSHPSDGAVVLNFDPHLGSLRSRAYRRICLSSLCQGRARGACF